jgi:hypothetical protein
MGGREGRLENKAGGPAGALPNAGLFSTNPF